MRLWIKDSERRPGPPPVQTDDRTPILTGIAAWIVALVVILVLVSTGVLSDPIWIATCIVGIVLGMLGLLYLRLRDR
ncbi:MAG: hypothetical protein RI885_1093 [Actinomycetota bacterium]|jgi:hypothetical protein